MKITTAALLAAFALNGCAKKHGDYTAEAAPSASHDESRAAAGSAAGNDQEKPKDGKTGIAVKHVDTRKVIRTGRLDLVVESVDMSRAKLEALVQSAGGYIDSTQVEMHGGSNSAVIVIRVPAEAFGTMLPTLHQIGEVTTETTNANDITDQFVDTEAQLASAQQLEKRLLELATAKNGSLDQVLTVERELARVRGEIESHQGHLKQWNDQTSLSTLTIAMTQRVVAMAAAPLPPPKTLGGKTSESFHSSIDALRDLGAWLLINGVALLPWLLFLVPAGVGLRRYMRKHRRLPVATVVTPPSV
jgi:hypothetical protein